MRLTRHRLKVFIDYDKRCLVSYDLSEIDAGGLTEEQKKWLFN